jgi:hypothetical protein
VRHDDRGKTARRDSVLIDSDMDFTEATERLQAHSERDARRMKRQGG